MRIGIYARVRSEQGGVFRYTVTFLEMLRALDLEDEVVLLHRRKADLPMSDLIGGAWSEARLPSGLMDVLQDVGVALVGEQLARRVWYYATRLRSGSVLLAPNGDPRFDGIGARWYRDRALDLVIYPVYSVKAFETRVPSAVTVHDLNHRLYTEFPEIRALGEFERREYYFRNACRSALTLFVESETGKEDLLDYYADTGVDGDRIVVLPMLPASSVNPRVSASERARVSDRYGLSEDYLFYPAQFWPHKNHLRLVEALYHLKYGAGLTPTLVLGGSYSGALRRRTFAAAMRAARRLGVDRQVRHLGFIPDQDMSALYSAAACLVMPTFFGPTNIPVLEAFAMGCPVVTSDIRGIREQTDGAAVLVNPRDSEGIADGLRRVLTSTDLRTGLIRRGWEVLAKYTPQDYRRILKGALEDTKVRLGQTRSAAPTPPNGQA
ncbi:MAG TPA: glycosyltransferase family 1 protein [Gemmatimonadaceae bacterium]